VSRPVSRDTVPRDQEAEPADDAEEPVDARLAACAVAAWVSCALGLGAEPVMAVGVAVALVLAGLACLRRFDARVVVVLLAAGAGLLVAGLRLGVSDTGPVPDLAELGAVVEADLTVTSDPRVVTGAFGNLVVLSARLDLVTARGVSTRVRSPVTVFADPDWADAALGSSVHVVGRLQESDDRRSAAVLVPTRVVGAADEPPWWWGASSVLRAGVTEGVASGGTPQRTLVPALVDGDDAAVPDDLDEAFRTAGLTHLLAVSGTNLTLMIAFLLLVARLLGVRGHGQLVVGVLGTAGFVLLARPEPSVLRAAAMGLVAIAGLGAGGRRRGIRALSLAVLVLVLLDPWLARSPGFALSAMATGGILVLGPVWRDAMSRWMPRWLAEAIAIPLAAQLACTPVVALLSGQVSVVAVVANMLVAPVVAPVTILGLVGGLVALVWTAPAHLIGEAACALAWWIITVARHSAAMPGAAVEWGSGGSAVVALTLGCLLGSVLLHWVLARPWLCSLCAVAMLGWILSPVRIGWPPDGWVMVACDVGQGDGLVLDAGAGAAVVVDTGPDPGLMDGCLDRLGVQQVPVVVLTHPHADHVAGLDGVGQGRAVGAVAIGPGASADPAYAATLSWARSRDVPIVELPYASTTRVGGLTWTVLGPAPGFESSGEVEIGASESESGATNDSSVVLSVTTSSDVVLLLTGDIEPAAQEVLEGWGSALHADVVKVPHHGSSRQDADFFAATGAELAVVSAGRDNDYGHPAPQALDLLGELGIEVVRTDLLGDVAVVADEDGVVTWEE
jgi:competence protein ComEC